jgi:putative transposase
LKERGLKGVKLLVSNTCLGLLENLADFYPEASWQRCVVDFYRNVWTAVSTGKVKEMAAMLKGVQAQEGPQAAGEKAAHGFPCCRRLHARWGIGQPPQCG